MFLKSTIAIALHCTALFKIQEDHEHERDAIILPSSTIQIAKPNHFSIHASLAVLHSSATSHTECTTNIFRDVHRYENDAI